MNKLIEETKRMKEVEIFLSKLKSLSKEKIKMFFSNPDIEKLQYFFEYCIVYTAIKNDVELLSLFVNHTSKDTDLYYSQALESTMQNNCLEARDFLLTKEHFLESLKIHNLELYEYSKKLIFKNKIYDF